MHSAIPETAAIEHDQKPRKFLFVASTGGHLAQLTRLSERFNPTAESMWVTFDSPQSRSLLAGKRQKFVPYIGQRDWRGVLRARKLMRDLFKEESFEHVVSTGAALALAALPVSAASRIPTTYIESVSRVEGPSLTGRLLAFNHKIQLRTQHPSWSDARWKAHASVLSSFETALHAPILSPKLFVTLGTLEQYRFDSLIDSVLATGLANEDTIWQLGSTTRSNLPGRAFEFLNAAQFDQAVANADVVISHAGVGTFLQVLEAGLHPVLAVRRRVRNEHIDDHQAQIASLANDTGVAIAREVDQLTATDILHAARVRVSPRKTRTGD